MLRLELSSPSGLADSTNWRKMMRRGRTFAPKSVIIGTLQYIIINTNGYCALLTILLAKLCEAPELLLYILYNVGYFAIVVPHQWPVSTIYKP